MIQSFEPICDENSRLLILGTMPSPASLEAGMYYSHPRNAFWPILRDLAGEEPGASREEKRLFLLRHGIALWDTLGRCDREGALDGNIRQEQPNAVAALVASCPKLAVVFLNGGAAYKYYLRYHATGRNSAVGRNSAAGVSLPYFLLPSTSPANARGGYIKKLEAWRIVAEYFS